MTDENTTLRECTIHVKDLKTGKVEVMRRLLSDDQIRELTSAGAAVYYPGSRVN